MLIIQRIPAIAPTIKSVEATLAEVHHLADHGLIAFRTSHVKRTSPAGPCEPTGVS